MTQVVLLGYGGPETPEEVRPFLDRIVAGRRIPPARYEQVVANYQTIGGRSPFNEWTRRQAAALQAELEHRGVNVPVRTAYRFAAPFITDVANESQRQGEDTIAIVLAAHQSEASWQKYLELFPGAHFTEPFFDAPGFLAAHDDRVRAALATLGRDSFDDVALVFTAHSIPVEMAERSNYVEQLRTTCELVSQRVGARRFDIAYTSRTGSPSEPWLEPDVRDLLRTLAADGTVDVVVDPAGFLCDHVEVMYDLDVDAAAVARGLGMRMARAAAVNDHPAFISALADRVEACLV